MADIPIGVTFQTKYEAAGAKALDAALQQFGMRLRLTGRDWLRLGTVAAGFFSGVFGQFQSLLNQSLDFQAVMADIQLAFADIANVVGAVLVPVITPFVGFLEMIANVLEGNPWLVWILGGTILITIIGMIASQLLKAFGFMDLWIGGIITATKTGLSFGEALRFLWIQYTQGKMAAAEYLTTIKKISSVHALTAKQTDQEVAALKRKRINLVLERSELLDRLRVANAVQTKDKKDIELMGFLDKALADNGKSLKKTNAEINKKTKIAAKAKKETKASGEEEKKSAAKGGILNKIFKSRAGTMKSLLSMGATLVGTGIAIFGAWSALAPVMDDLNSLFQAVGGTVVESLMPIIEPVMNFISGLVAWFEQLNGPAKEIVSALIAIGGGLLALMAAANFLSPVKKGFDLINKSITDEHGLLNKLWTNIAGKAGSIKSTLSGVFDTISSKVTSGLDAVQKFISGGLDKMKGALDSAGIGTKSLALGVAGLIGGFLLGYTLARMFINAFGPMGAVIMPLIGIVWSLTAAILALYGTISWGTALPLLLAGIGIAVGGAIAGAGIKIPIPGMASGGLIAKGGIARLHTGEEVRPAEVAKKKPQSMQQPITININAPIGSKEIAKSFADEVGKILDKKYSRSR